MKRILVFILVSVLVVSCSNLMYAHDGSEEVTGYSPIPPEARLEDISKPDHIIGRGTPESCTAEAFIEAVAKGGTIVFNGGSEPFTIYLTEQAMIYNDASEDVVIDGGGLVTLDGGGETRLIYMNTCDSELTWTTSHCQNQDHPRLTVQNINFSNGNSENDKEYSGGGALWIRGGRFKAINCTFTNNVCESEGPDVGGGALRVFSQYEGLPVYLVNCIFGGEQGKGNVGSNGGAISSISVSWTIINSVFSYNKAIGHGGNPAKPGTVGGGSGGAIYNDGNEMTLKLIGSTVVNNEVNAYGSGIFFVTNNHTGEIQLYDSILENNIGGSWYPVHPNISMHSDTQLKIVDYKNMDILKGQALPTSSLILVDEVPVKFESYLINDYNYFKLRDIAWILKGSSKQFEITWDAKEMLIGLRSGEAYTTLGDELSVTNTEFEKVYEQARPNILVDGMPIHLKSYLIEDYNYFKLRDLGTLFDFGIGWDYDKNLITIRTNQSYDDQLNP